jgi:hypothetical protein
MKNAWLLLVLLAGPAAATTLSSDPARTQFEALAARADAAVHVEVGQQTYRLVGGRIVTDSRCRVINAGYGAEVGDSITVTTLGGRWGAYAQKVDGIEPFVPGDHVAMLLSAPGYMEGGRRIVGFSYGIYRTIGEGDAAQALGVDLPATARDDNPLTVAEFLTRASAAKQAATKAAP